MTPVSMAQVSWYEDLPSSWVTGRIKSVSTRVTDGAHISPDTNGGAFHFVSTRDLKEGAIDFAGSLKTSPATYEYMEDYAKP
jgi:type I restriction enzyme S subunit